jgi:inosose dehydratase
VPDAIAVLDAVQRAGYGGIDLGPPGYLGRGPELPQRLQTRGLHLAGGYIAMPLSEPARMPAAIEELSRLLDTFDSVYPLPDPPHKGEGERKDRPHKGEGVRKDSPRKGEGEFPPRPTLADAGSEARRLTPGRAHDDPSLMLDAAGWSRFAEGVNRAAGICRERGYEPTFHHHGASYIETPQEIEEMLRRTDVDLCLDTGHIVIGGGDPLRAAADWGARINHLHLKDVGRSVVERVIAEEGLMLDFWREGAFCPLGDGDLDIDGILQEIRKAGFSGWLVVEQDMLPRPDESSERAARDQQRNREYLRARGI